MNFLDMCQGCTASEASVSSQSKAPAFIALLLFPAARQPGNPEWRRGRGRPGWGAVQYACPRQRGAIEES